MDGVPDRVLRNIEEHNLLYTASWKNYNIIVVVNLLGKKINHV